MKRNLRILGGLAALLFAVRAVIWATVPEEP
jgi:hypothetical protein